MEIGEHDNSKENYEKEVCSTLLLCLNIMNKNAFQSKAHHPCNIHHKNNFAI